MVNIKKALDPLVRRRLRYSSSRRRGKRFRRRKVFPFLLQPLVKVMRKAVNKKRRYSHILPQSQEALSSYYFLSTMRGNCDKDGKEKLIQVPIGMSMLEAAHKNDTELEVNSYLFAYRPLSSHVLDHLRLSNTTDMEYCNKLEDPADEENDMLDPAFGLTEMSCLGCQVIAKPELDGMWLALPEAT